MKTKSLGILFPLSIQGKILIAIEEKWKKFFQDIPMFEVVIKDGRYSLLGPKVNCNRDRKRHTPIQEEKYD